MGRSKRRSRFHTESGTLCIDPFQLSFAFVTTLLRRTAGYHVPFPWLVWPAIRFLSREVKDKDIFEFGSGNSTSWYADRCKLVVSVEDDSAWYQIQVNKLGTRDNVRVVFESDPKDYASAIRKFDRTYDRVVIDGSHRLQCLENSIDFVRPGGVLVVDNTDEQTRLSDFIKSKFSSENIIVMSGYAPGSFYAKETTIVRLP